MERSLFEYFYNPDGAQGYKCGYCKSEDTSISQGMWAHKLTCQDYQDLIYRGWRRSGKYCYKPALDKTCCPQYCIRCDAKNFQLSLSQRKVLKKMNKFLAHGIQDTTKVKGQASSEVVVDAVKTRAVGCEVKQAINPGVGADPDKPPCRKAKVIRLERKREKAAANSAKHDSQAANKETSLEASSEKPKGAMTVTASSDRSKVDTNGKTPLEVYLNDSLQSASTSASPPTHKLEVRLIQSSPPSPEFKATFQASFNLFKSYQIAVHKEQPDQCTESSFRRFLCNSPLVAETGPSGWPMGYGSFHQHYLVDGKLVAVGVVDLLPKCLSSVYVYFDINYSFLSLGVYSALREIALTRSLIAHDPGLFQDYCMGFYIHSCPKMRYKAQYDPSFLLCPESYCFVPVQICMAKLDVKKYSRLYDGDWVKDKSVEIDSLLTLYRNSLIPYRILKPVEKDKSRDQVTEFVTLVGSDVAKQCILILH